MEGLWVDTEAVVKFFASAAKPVDFGGERRQPVRFMPAQVRDAGQLRWGRRLRGQRRDGRGELADVSHVQADALPIIGLTTPGVQVENIATTAKTLPDFPTMWHTALQHEEA